MYRKLIDIPFYREWSLVKKINEGWSNDEKYYVEDKKGNKLLVRLTHISTIEDKKREFDLIKKFNKLSFEMSKAISFGFCNNNHNIYMILSWVEGKPLSLCLSDLPKNEQYDLGVKAGRILREIHSLKAESSEELIKNGILKIMTKIDKYKEGKFRLDNDEKVISFIENNINKLNNQPVVFKHRDFHVGNLILTPEKDIGVIDFNRWGIGDPYEEFYKIQSFDVEVSIPFSVGQINGYFDNNPPKEFWDILAIYVAYSSLTSITWAESFGKDEIEAMQRRALNAFKDYEYFENKIPNWYKGHEY